MPNTFDPAQAILAQNVVWCKVSLVVSSQTEVHVVGHHAEASFWKRLDVASVGYLDTGACGRANVQVWANIGPRNAPDARWVESGTPCGSSDGAVPHSIDAGGDESYKRLQQKGQLEVHVFTIWEMHQYRMVARPRSCSDICFWQKWSFGHYVFKR